MSGGATLTIHTDPYPPSYHVPSPWHADSHCTPQRFRLFLDVGLPPTHAPGGDCNPDVSAPDRWAKWALYNHATHHQGTSPLTPLPGYIHQASRHSLTNPALWPTTEMTRYKRGQYSMRRFTLRRYDGQHTRLDSRTRDTSCHHAGE